MYGDIFIPFILNIVLSIIVIKLSIDGHRQREQINVLLEWIDIISEGRGKVKKIDDGEYILTDESEEEKPTQA